MKFLKLPINPFSHKLFHNVFYSFFFRYIKISKNLSAKYYQENKEILQKIPRSRYQNLSKEEREKKWQYGHELYKNLPEDAKRKLVEYRKNTEKNRFVIIMRKYIN